MYIYISRVGHAFMGTHCCWRPSLFGYPRKQLGIYCDAPTNKMFTQASMQQMLYMLTLTVVCMHFCKFPLFVRTTCPLTLEHSYLEKHEGGIHYATKTRAGHTPCTRAAWEHSHKYIAVPSPDSSHKGREGRTAFTTAH
jgi:hypothetical protein